MQAKDLILVLDFGAPYTHNVAKAVRAAQVYSEILPCHTKAELIAAKQPKGLILAGGPHTAHAGGGYAVDLGLAALNLPTVEADATATAESLASFLFDTCGCRRQWNMEDFTAQALADIRAQVGDKQVLLGLSGGVDSSVVCALLHRAIGSQLTAVFVDSGLMRKNEPESVEAVFRPLLGDKLLMVDARDRFLGELAGVSDPETKRKIIGRLFIEVFADTARSLGQLDFLAQGTIYPDIIESTTVGGKTIKSHHNVGGLPKDLPFCGLVEPLRPLFKDEVRALGRSLGLPDTMTERQPFPGPGLGVRVVGDITREKLDLLREADAIVREEIGKIAGAVGASQYFAVLTGLKSVGVRNEERSYDNCICVRAIQTADFMSVDWVRLPYETLDTISTRITSEVPHVNRVVYDITSKPPAAVEFE